VRQLEVTYQKQSPNLIDGVHLTSPMDSPGCDLIIRNYAYCIFAMSCAAIPAWVKPACSALATIAMRLWIKPEKAASLGRDGGLISVRRYGGRISKVSGRPGSARPPIAGGSGTFA